MLIDGLRIEIVGLDGAPLPTDPLKQAVYDVLRHRSPMS